MENEEEELTGEQIQRFIEMQAEDGKTPLETITAPLKLVGADKIPEFKTEDLRCLVVPP